MSSWSTPLNHSLLSTSPTPLRTSQRLVPRSTPPPFGVYALRGERNRHDKGSNYHGKLVDDNLIVLRMRIRETEVAERSGRWKPPADWMEWEKRYYGENYNSDICEAMGILQSVLMNTRPGVALGMMALFALSLPTSAAVVLFHFVGLVKEGFGL